MGKMRYTPEQYGDWCLDVEKQFISVAKSIESIVDKLDGDTQDEVFSRHFFQSLHGKILEINNVLHDTEVHLREV